MGRLFDRCLAWLIRELGWLPGFGWLGTLRLRTNRSYRDLIARIQMGERFPEEPCPHCGRVILCGPPCCAARDDGNGGWK